MLEILVIAFVVLLSVGIWLAVLEPLLNVPPTAGEDDRGARTLDVLEDLYARRDTLYASIKELEFDRRVGKIGEEDFQRFSARLKREAADVLRRIEEVKQAQAIFRERLEAQVQALSAIASDGAVLEEPPEQVERPAPSAIAPRFCTQCGHRLQPGDRFCSQCGTPVREVVR